MEDKKPMYFDKMEFANIQTPNFIQESYNLGRGYINFGWNNLFPQELMLYSDKSTTHSACLNLIQMSIAGEGFTTLTSESKSFLELQDYETSNSTILEKISTALSIFDGASIEIIWNKTGKQIVEIHYIPYENLRAGTPDRYGNVSQYFYNCNWEHKPNDYEIIPAFNPSLSRDFPKQILYFGLQNIVSAVYPVPKYSSAINYIAGEQELSKHNLSSIVNGFIPSALITFFGNPTAEQRALNKQLFKNNFEGSENSGKMIIAYAETPDQKVQIDSLQLNNSVDYYMNSSNENKERIITSHNIISPALIAIGDGNSSIFSNGDELKVAWDVFYNTKIKSYQKLIQKTYNLILKYSGFPNEKFTIIPFSPITIVEDTTNITDTTGNETISNDLPETDASTSGNII